MLAELETDKVNLEISAEEDGVISSILRQAGENVAVGEAIGIIGSAAGAGAASKPAADSAPQGGSAPAAAASAAAAEPAAAVTAPAAAEGAAAGTAALASPGARKLARERGIDLGEVSARDPIGRIGQADVDGHGAAGPQAAAPAAPAARPEPAKPAPPAAGKAPHAEDGKATERKRMSRRRLTIASRLVEAQQTAAMLTTFNEVDMTAILDIRKRRKDAFKEKHEVGLGFMSFFTKAVIGALKAYPMLNAEIDGEDLLLKKYYDIGIAVAAKEGLVVPVVRDADRLSFLRSSGGSASWPPRRAPIRSACRSYRVEPSPSRTAECSAPCCPHRSSIPRRSAFSACTKSSCAPSRWMRSARPTVR